MFKIKIENIDLDIIKRSLKRVGKQELVEAELFKFAKETLIHEQEKTVSQEALYEEKEIEENEINQFAFHDDGYRTGILAEFSEKNLLTISRDKDEFGVITEYKAQPIGEDGTRIRLVLITRRGYMTIFTSSSWLETINEAAEKNKSENFILVGSLKTKYKNKRTQQYDSFKQENEEYHLIENYTFNLWQLIQIIKKGKSAFLKIIEKPIEE